jgi:NAD(P)-dependent dehydrogenase (short-subunit alcohol dehydrogenase family)
VEPVLTADGPVAVVTGAAAGVGRAVVQALLADGFRLVAEDLSPEVAAQAEPAVLPLVGDVSEPGTAAAAVRTALDTWGRLDVVVNNAGVYLSRGIDATTTNDWDRVLAVNTRGAFLHVREAAVALRDSPVAAVVNVASISGLIGLSNQVAYAASKGALIAMTRALAVELAPDGVRVNAVAPGGIDTGFTSAALADIDDVPAYREQVAAKHPRGQVSSAAEVARVVAFLATPASVAMTGAVVSVDGGYTAQ